LDRVNKLEEQLKLLKAKRFGKSSEKLERRIDIVERLLEEGGVVTRIPDK
jgi:hypothetical protein